MRGPFRIGLTGGIGMGKSTTATMFADRGASVWDADAAVHRLYAPGGAAVALVAELCPRALAGGGIDRAALSAWLKPDPGRLAQLESIVHPLVAADRAAFLASCPADIAVLDIPLLFETGSDVQMDLTVTVSVPAALQRQRVLNRPGMTDDKLALILARQMTDTDRRARADVVIDTSTLEGARQAVVKVMADIRAGKHARNRLRH